MSFRDHRRRPFWHLRRGANQVSSEIDEELSGLSGEIVGEAVVFSGGNRCRHRESSGGGGGWGNPDRLGRDFQRNEP